MSYAIVMDILTVFWILIGITYVIAFVVNWANDLLQTDYKAVLLIPFAAVLISSLIAVIIYNYNKFVN